VGWEDLLVRFLLLSRGSGLLGLDLGELRPLEIIPRPLRSVRENKLVHEGSCCGGGGMYSFVDRVPPEIDSPANARLDDDRADEDEGEVARVALEQVLVDPVAGVGGLKSVHPVCEMAND